MYAGVACGCCMGNMVVILEYTPSLPCPHTFFTSSSLLYSTFYLIFQKIFMCFYKWGKPEWAPHWSWQRPVRNMLSIYLSIYVSFTQHLPHPGSRDPCTPWNAPCISVYWHVHVLHSTEQQGRLELLVSTVKIIRQVGEYADTWYKPQIQSTETVDL